MFDIFHKRSKVVVDAFTDNAFVHKHYTIDRGTKHIPDWFKKMPMFFHGQQGNFKIEVPTMKGCIAITDLFKSSFVIQNWQETLCRCVDGNFDIETSSKQSNSHSFHEDQKSSEFKEVSHIKIDTPWLLREKEGVTFLLTDTFWNNYNHHKRFHYKVAPGMISFNKQHSLNVNIVAKKNTPDFKIDAGEPIAQLYPMTDKIVEIRHHLVSGEEMLKIHQSYAYKHVFRGKWGRNRKLENDR